MATAKPLELTLHASIKGKPATLVCEHPWVVRFCHWLNAIALLVLIGSGLRIFRAFPSFGTKLPQNDLLDIPKAFTIGGWLGGALQWHFTFMWIFVGTGMLYLAYQFATGHFRQVLFMPRDLNSWCCCTGGIISIPC